MGKVAINNFVRRQTENSQFSHFTGTWDELIELVEKNFDRAQSGYRDGVVLVPVPAEGFFTGVVEVNEASELLAKFEARRSGEEPYVRVLARGEKLPAEAVEIVLYRHDVLGDDASACVEWEIVSINARPTEGPEPMSPVAMARNFLDLPGGTKADYSAEEFARAIIYWSKRAMIAVE